MSMSRKRPAERESEPPLASSSSRKRERESEPPLDWRKSLTVDSLVEALDVQNLWYPARVIQMEGSKVLLHFLGWGDEWDDGCFGAPGALGPRAPKNPEKSR